MLSFERLIVVKRLPGPVSVSVNQGVSGVIVRVACCTRSLSLPALPCACDHLKQGPGRGGSRSSRVDGIAIEDISVSVQQDHHVLAFPADPYVDPYVSRACRAFAVDTRDQDDSLDQGRMLPCGVLE